MEKTTADKNYETICGGYVDGCRILVPEWYQNRRGVDVPSADFHYKIQDVALAENADGSRVNPFVAIRASRGSAKSTSFTKAKHTWQLLMSAMVDEVEEYDVIASASFRQAWAWFRSIVDALLYSPHVEYYFGKVQKGGYWRYGDGDVELVFPNGRRSRLRCAGAGMDIRGDQSGSIRPTGITLDDITRDDESRTEDGRKSRVDWVLSSVIPALDPDGWLHNIGTPRPYTDDWNAGVIEKLAKSGHFNLSTYPAATDITDPNGPLLWPERIDYKFLRSKLEMFKATGREWLFWSEYMCKVTSQTRKVFRREWYENNRWSGQLVKSPAGPYLIVDGYGRVPVNTYVGMDPSFSDARRSDLTVISCWGVSPDDHPHYPRHWWQIDELASREIGSDEAVREFIYMGARNQVQHVMNERVAAQEALTRWAREVMEDLIKAGELDHYFDVLDYPPSNRDKKEKRIAEFLRTPYALGRVHHKEGIHRGHEAEMEEFPATHPDRTDAQVYALIESDSPGHLAPDEILKAEKAPTKFDWMTGAPLGNSVYR